MNQKSNLPETLYIRLSKDDKHWIQERSNALTVKPTVYARMLLSKAIKTDRQEPGKFLTGTA
jgi:hypothetical protein